MRLKFARSQILTRCIAEFLLTRGFFLLFLISLVRAAFWLCSRKCLRSGAWALSLKSVCWEGSVVLAKQSAILVLLKIVVKKRLVCIKN